VSSLTKGERFQRWCSLNDARDNLGHVESRCIAGSEFVLVLPRSSDATDLKDSEVW
jgi:hypothetical protein